uniref:Ribosomal protein L6 n=1 Tax=Pyramimonas parkeae TaxID=36894 RepID=A0A1D8I1U7_9CHLO|nr:ribosomal protein L6 [Pyramimonas parkeae]AOT98945.1 ribosomal protein L6 [Pyramimonas parkeae]
MLYYKKLPLPEDISIFWEKGSWILQGPLGILKLSSLNHSEGFRIKFLTHPRNFQKFIFLMHEINDRRTQASGQTLISLFSQKILGISHGFFLNLDIRGIGYRVSIEETRLTFKLGYSHEIFLQNSPNMRFFSPKSNILSIYSIKFQELTQICERIRQFKKIEPYKGKGIRFVGEQVPIKIGKKK